MEIFYRNYLVRPSKNFVLKLVQKFISAAAFIPFLLISSILITCLSSIAFSAEISLTPEEQAWLQEHPDIKLGAPTSYPPLVIKNAKGPHTGMLVDLFDLINQRLNTNIRLHIEDSWPSIQEKAKNRNIDGLASGGRSANREEYLNHTDALFSTYYYVFARTNDQLHLKSVKDLEGMRIGYKAADTPVRSLLDKYTGVTPVPYTDNAAMTKGLMNKEVNVLVAWISYDFWRRDKLQGSVDNILLATDNPLNSYIHIRKDWPELIPILNKVLSSIHQNELPKIMDTWFIERPRLPAIVKIPLTKKEQAWLTQNHTVRVHVANFPPYMILRKDEITGISIDYLNLIAQRTGVSFEFVPGTQPWQKSLESLINLQGPDLITSLSPIAERKPYMNFSAPYVVSPRMIFTQPNAESVYSIDDLNGRTLAVPYGTLVHKRIEVEYADIGLLICDTDVESIEAVSTGKADAYIGNLINASYEILNRGLSNLKVACPSPFGDDVYTFGTRKDWPELNSIINKALDTISVEEKTKIHNKHIKLLYEHGIKTGDVLKWGLLTAGLTLGIVLIFMAWNRSLSIKVKERTFSLENSKKSLEFQITERKKAEIEIKRAKQKAERYLNLAGVMFIGLDTDENINVANRKACQILEVQQKDILGQKWFDNFIPQNTRPEVRSVFRQIIDGTIEPVKYYENLIITKTGKEKQIAWHNTILKDDDGNIIGILGSGEDITEKKQLQFKLQQSQKMESIGNLAGGIAHDFNNILSSIIGFTELTLDEIEKGSFAEDNLQEVYSAGKRAKDLVKQILTFARQSGDEIKPIQTNLIAKEVIQFVRSSIPTTIEIKQKIESNSLILGNATQLHQIFMNLCTNAAHAMEDEGGILEMVVREISVDRLINWKNPELKPGPYIEIVVSDTGSGIEPGTIEKIFEPYFTTKKPGEGTGMGLALVHGIVESYGGKIQVKSILGKGTTFTLYLPITKKRDEKSLYEIESLPSGTENILFVDDEISITKMGSRTLGQLGYCVTAKTSSEEALKLFRSNPKNFDLLITDMTMPNMTGDKLAIELMKIRSDIPVILCTGYSKKMSEETASKIGIKALAYKPIVKADLAKTVRKVLDEANPSE